MESRTPAVTWQTFKARNPCLETSVVKLGTFLAEVYLTVRRAR